MNLLDKYNKKTKNKKNMFYLRNYIINYFEIIEYQKTTF